MGTVVVQRQPRSRQADSSHLMERVAQNHKFLSCMYVAEEGERESSSYASSYVALLGSSMSVTTHLSVPYLKL